MGMGASNTTRVPGPRAPPRFRALGWGWVIWELASASGARSRDRLRPVPRRDVLIIIGLAVAVGLVGAGVTAYVQSHQSCTVGYYGTDLEISAVGWHANDLCHELLDAAGTDAYTLDQPDPSATLMCRDTVRGTEMTVRDKGALKLYGTAGCKVVEERRAKEGP